MIGKYHLSRFPLYMKTRQIIRYRATATLRRPLIKQYTLSKTSKRRNINIGTKPCRQLSYNFQHNVGFMSYKINISNAYTYPMTTLSHNHVFGKYILSFGFGFSFFAILLPGFNVMSTLTFTLTLTLTAGTGFGWTGFAMETPSMLAILEILSFDTFAMPVIRRRCDTFTVAEIIRFL